MPAPCEVTRPAMKMRGNVVAAVSRAMRWRARLYDSRCIGFRVSGFGFRVRAKTSCLYPIPEPRTPIPVCSGFGFRVSGQSKDFLSLPDTRTPNPDTRLFGFRVSGFGSEQRLLIFTRYPNP